MTLSIANFYKAAASLGDNHTLRLMPKGDRLATSWQDRLVVAWNDIGRDTKSIAKDKEKVWTVFVTTAQFSGVKNLGSDVNDAYTERKFDSLKGKDVKNLLREAKQFNPEKFPAEPASKITKWLASIGDLTRPSKKPEAKPEAKQEPSVAESDATVTRNAEQLLAGPEGDIYARKPKYTFDNNDDYLSEDEGEDVIEDEGKVAWEGELKFAAPEDGKKT